MCVCATLSPFPFCHLDLFAPEGHQWGRMAPWQRCAATRQGQRSRESAAEWWNREVKQKGELKGIFLRNPFWRQKQKKREETFLYLSRNDINAHTKKERERHLMFCRLTSLQQQKQNKKKPIEQIEKEKTHRPLNRCLKKREVWSGQTEGERARAEVYISL